MLYPDNSASDSDIVFPKPKHTISMFLRLCNQTFCKHNPTALCRCASWYCPIKCNQSIASYITPPTFIWKWWNNWMLAGINIYEQVSCTSDTCIYLMFKETQLSKMIIIHTFQCFSGRIIKSIDIKGGQSNILQLGHSEILYKWCLKLYSYYSEFYWIENVKKK